MVTQEDVELAYQEAMMNMARLNRTGTVVGGCLLQGRHGAKMGNVPGPAGHAQSPFTHSTLLNSVFHVILVYINF